MLTILGMEQVSNWFINARVRLWKPMVEEMYVEEMKENERNESEDKTSKSGEESPAMKIQERGPASETESKSFNSNQDVAKNQNTPIVSVSTPSTSPVGGNVRNQSAFSFMQELDGLTQGSPKRTRNHEILMSPNRVSSINMDIKSNETNNEALSRDGYSFIGNQTNFIGGFGQYPMEEIGRFDAEQFTPRFSGNGVSLTLGLPHCETISGTHHQTFIPNQNIPIGRRLDISEPNEFGAMNTSNSHSSAAFESINMQNPKRFAAQLLPDFVA